VKEGDAIALMLRNDFPFFEGTVGAGTLGAFAVPINWHFHKEEAEYILRDSGSKALVVHADLLPQIEGGIPESVRVLVVETPPEIQSAYGVSDAHCRVPAGMEAWDGFVQDYAPWPDPPKQFRSAMLYTSGTTGHPKGVRRQPMTPEQVVEITQRAHEVFGIHPGLRTIITGPMYHATPNFFGLYSLRVGGTIVLQPRFDSEETLALIEKHRVTAVHLVPTMFVRMLKLPAATREKYDLSSLENVSHGAAPCPPEVKRAMIDWFGPVITEYYGSTESGVIVAASSTEWLAHPGSVGKPVQGAELAIYDDDGNPLPTGEVGEIFVRLAAYPEFTYYGKDEKRREIERNGLITCGDVGYVDEDGFLYLCDRKKDMVISGGVNIYPAEIEAVLHGVPGVHDCAVFGIPDEEFGESLAAVIEPESGARLTATGIQEALREHLAGYKIPKRIDFQTDLPREDSGKIFKRKLREPYWQQTGRQI
jgi:long-chain acyl-CoA synthetase